MIIIVILFSLIKNLEYTYDTIPFEPLFKNLKLDISKKVENIIHEINLHKKTYIINWKGNPQNTHEISNRSMKLENAIPLFQLNNINWIVITKDITKKEKMILDEYDVKYYGDEIDNENAFYDSIPIIRNVKGVFSTDTSLLHLSANLGALTYAILTVGL